MTCLTITVLNRQFSMIFLNDSRKILTYVLEKLSTISLLLSDQNNFCVYNLQANITADVIDTFILLNLRKFVVFPDDINRGI